MNKNKVLDLAVIFTDLLSLVISYVLGSLFYLLVINDRKVFMDRSFYPTFLIFLFSFSIVELLLLNRNRLFLKRNSVEEIYNIIKNALILGVVVSTIGFIARISYDISRGVLLITLLLFVLVGTINRYII